MSTSVLSLFFVLATQELRPSQLESVGDPVQSGGILLHVVQLRDLRGGVAQQVRHLPGRQGLEAAVRLFHAVYQVGGKGVPEGVQALLFDPRRLEDAVVPLPKVQRAGVLPVLIGDEGRVLSLVYSKTGRSENENQRRNP